MQVLKDFRYGGPFLEINSQLLKRYAACENEEDIKATEEKWLDKIEREYSESRAERAEDDVWKRGNTNHMGFADSEEEDDEGDEDAESKDEEDEERDIYDLPEESDDEEEMAELRRKVLNSKPFQDLKQPDTQPPNETIQKPQPSDQKVDAGSDCEEASDDGDDEDVAFDRVIDATTTTDRTGILAMQRQRKQQEKGLAFSRNSKPRAIP